MRDLGSPGIGLSSGNPEGCKQGSFRRGQGFLLDMLCLNGRTVASLDDGAGAVSTADVTAVCGQ